MELKQISENFVNFDVNINRTFMELKPGIDHNVTAIAGY